MWQWQDIIKKDPTKEPQATAVAVFNHALALVEGRVVDAWVDRIPDDWRAAKEFLQVRFPDEWGPAAQVQVHVEGEVQHVHSLTDGDLLAVAEVLKEVGAIPILDADIVDS